MAVAVTNTTAGLSGKTLAVLETAQTFTAAQTFSAAIISDATTDSTSTLTGAIQTDGGLGVAKALWVGGLANIAGAVTLQSTLAVTGATTLSSTLTVNGFGTHAFSAGGTGANLLTVRNTTDGTANLGQIIVGNDTGTVVQIEALATSFTPVGVRVAAGSAFRHHGAGGVSISAEHASGVIRFYSGGATERARFAASGFFELKGDMSVPATNKIYLDGGGDTYMYESSSNVLEVVAGGVTQAKFNNAGTGMSIPASAKLYLDGGSNTYMHEVAADTIQFVTGGSACFELSSIGNGYFYNNLFIAGHGTTASAANAFIDSADNGKVLRSTSSLRYKTNVETLDAEHARNVVLSMRPITYLGINDGATRFTGFAAEEVAELDPMLVTFDKQGRPDYVTYDRITSYLVPVAQQHDVRIAALEARLG